MMRTEYALGFLFNLRMNRVVLIRKNRPTWQQGKLNGIGGHVEKGETHLECMEREFKEETGVLVPQEDWNYIALLYGAKFKMPVFSAFSDAIFETKTMTDEKVSINTIQHLDYNTCISNVRWLIGLCLDRDGPRIHANIEYYTDGV